MGLVIPAFTPDELGEIYVYTPTIHELRIGAGIFSVGFLVFTLLCRIAVPILTGEFAAANQATSGEKAADWVPGTSGAAAH